jgi:hypothetical protein
MGRFQRGFEKHSVGGFLLCICLQLVSLAL